VGCWGEDQLRDDQSEREKGRLTVDSLGESLLPLGRLEYLEGAHESVVDAHHRPRIVELPTVVGSREDSHELATSEELVPILDHLVGATDQVQIVPSQELSDYILAKCEGDTTVILSPPDDVFVRVGPEEVAEETSVGDVGGSHDPLHLLHVLELGAEAAVHAENLLVDNGSHGKAVEGVCEGLPQLDVVSPLACC
jgi:hypothetical protein